MIGTMPTPSSAPTGPAYVSVLILHVLSATIGFGTVFVTGVQAVRARRGPQSEAAESVKRYFRPGVNWAARAVYAVPVLGIVLLVMSRGAYDLSDGWVVAGLMLWIAAVFVGEAVHWPRERELQRVVSDGWERDPASEEKSLCAAVAASAFAMSACFVAAVVLMTGKP